MATEEIELLEAMFPEELKITGPNRLEITLRPRTDLNSSQGIFVFITLVFTLPKEYPAVSPVLTINHARGIDEAGTVKLVNDLKKKAAELSGSPALFELIHLARDLLTENNRPHEDCPICLIAFEENEDFVKTPCYHYFHIDCFMSYCQTSVGDLKCPLCREILSGDFLNTFVGKGLESASASSAPVPVKSVEEPPPPENVPAVPPSRFILVTNLGNQSKLDWLGLFDNVFKLYGAQSMTMVTVATVILEFKETSVAEIALANTDKTSIGGQKISCRFASQEEYDSSKQNIEVHQQLQQLNLQHVQEQKELQRQEQEQELQQQLLELQQNSPPPPQDSHNPKDATRHNKDNNKFRNTRHKPLRNPPSAHHPTNPTSNANASPLPPSSSSSPSPASSSSSKPHSRAPKEQFRKKKPANNSNNVNKKDGGSDVTVKS